MLTTDGPAIVFREAPPTPELRLFALVLAIGIGLILPAIFLVNVTRETPVSHLLLVGGIVVATVSLGGFFLRLALVGVAELRLDPQTGLATRILRGPLGHRCDHFPLSALAPPEVFVRPSEDGDVPILRLRLPNGRPLDAACYHSRTEAEAWRDRIRRLLPA